MIYFLCPDINKPAGGIKQIYRQVDVLNENGFEAAVVHRTYGFRCQWFKNTTPVAYNMNVFCEVDKANKTPLRKGKNLVFSVVKRVLKQVYNQTFYLLNQKQQCVVGDTDILVIPEVYGVVSKINLKSKIVIYNQNCFYTFRKSKNNKLDFYGSNVIALIVASQYSLNYMQYTFEKLDLYRVKYGFNKDVFFYGEKTKKTIAYMPRKLEEDSLQLLQIVMRRTQDLLGWRWVAIDGNTETETAKTLREAIFFLSFGQIEGFGMPPAEAMACGCVVVGYDGIGGCEFFKPEFSFNIRDRDIVSFAETLERLMRSYELNPSIIINLGKKASKYILNQYSLENEELSIVNTWSSIIEKCQN